MTPFSSPSGVGLSLGHDESEPGVNALSFDEEGFSAGGISYGLLGRSVGFYH